MEMKFDLTVANWLAFVADPSMSFSRLGYGDHEKEMIKLFLTKLVEGSFSSLNEPQDVVENLQLLLNRFVSDDSLVIEGAYAEIRHYLGKKQWIALIIPSGIEQAMDNVLCDPELLGYLVNMTPESQGLIVQLDEAPNTMIRLLDVHGVLKTALNKANTWPGILIWSPGGDSVFLPIGSVACLEIDIEARLQWVFSTLFSSSVFDLGNLNVRYKYEFPEVFENEIKTVNIIHLSDLHIGNVESSFRMARIQQCVRALVEELGQTSKIVPVITGNFMDNPSEKHIDKVSSFWEFLAGMGTEEPLLVFGNNDVRQDGNINESYRKAVGFQNNKVTWYENEKIAIISLNTVLHGNLEGGGVGEEQLSSISYEIERKVDNKDYKFLMLMHHLPDNPHKIDNVLQPFYEKIIGENFDTSKVIKNADLLFDFVRKYSVSVLLHGHQQVPVISQAQGQGNVSVVGCGATIGRRSKFDGNVYFSLNVISINCFSHAMSSRLLAIRKPEDGFVDDNRHEVIFRTVI